MGEVAHGVGALDPLEELDLAREALARGLGSWREDLEGASLSVGALDEVDLARAPLAEAGADRPLPDFALFVALEGQGRAELVGVLAALGGRASGAQLSDGRLDLFPRRELHRELRAGRALEAEGVAGEGLWDVEEGAAGRAEVGQRPPFEGRHGLLEGQDPRDHELLDEGEVRLRVEGRFEIDALGSGPESICNLCQRIHRAEPSGVAPARLMQTLVNKGVARNRSCVEGTCVEERDLGSLTERDRAGPLGGQSVLVHSARRKERAQGAQLALAGPARARPLPALPG